MANAAGAPSMMPADRMQLQQFDKTFPSNYLPSGALLPSYHGNPTRQFLDQDSYELTIGNRLVLPALLSYSVWSTSTNVLTSRCWPKIKLPEGVQMITQTEFTYNVVPVTRVPKRGTVRFMSKSTKSLSIALTQKGIGSIYEGSALNTAYGPQLIAMDIRAYAESVDQGQAINTAMGIVNAAHTSNLLKPAFPYGRNLSQDIAAELPRWAAAGVNPNAITNELEDMLSSNPAFDTVLRPDKMSRYFEGLGGIGKEIDITLFALDKNNEYVRAISPDKLIAGASLFNGSLAVFDMTQFKTKNTAKSFQPLECLNTIGEVYFMYPEDHPGKPGVFNSSILDTYLFDEPRDGFGKITALEVIRRGKIWDQQGYDSDFMAYFGNVKKSLSNLRDDSTPLVFPITVDKKSGPFLPRFWGNLSRRFMTTDQLSNTIESVVSQATYNTSGGNLPLTSAHEQIRQLDRLRETIEHEPYRADYWEEVARLNISRSVLNGAFVGTKTNKARAAAYDSKQIREWTANPLGALDIPANKGAAGLFSAAGLKTLAANKSHPLSEIASKSYGFLSAMTSSIFNTLRYSAIFGTTEMPVNLPMDDQVQLALTAIYGPRIPVFLAAPDRLIQSVVGTRNVIQPIDDRKELRLLGVVPATPSLDGNFSVKLASGGLYNTISANDVVMVQLPAGVWITLDASKWSWGAIAKKYNADLSSPTYRWMYGRFSELATSETSNDEIKAQVEQIVKIVIIANNDPADKIPQDLHELAQKLITTSKISKAESAKLLGLNIRGEQSYVNDRYKEILTVRDAKNIGNEPNILAYNRLTRALKTVEEEKGAAYLANTVIGVRASADMRRLDADAVDELEITRAAKAELKAAIDALTYAGLVVNVTKDVAVSSNESALVTALDIKGAAYFRTPMFFSYSLLESLESITAPWILPGDINNNFDSVVVGDQQGVIGVSQWNIPHVVQSRHDARGLVTEHWRDVGIFSRIGLISKAYDNVQSQTHHAAGSGFDAMDIDEVVNQGFDAPPQSRGPLMDTFHLHQGGKKNADTRKRADAHVSVVAQAGGLYESIFHGPMLDNIDYVMTTYESQPVHLLTGLAFLNTPMNTVPHIVDAVRHNVRLPFEMWIWRLFSRHMMGSLLVMVSGPSSGMNPYNGAKYTVQHDGDRDVWHTRVVITTDALAIKPENHQLIRNIQPRLYAGGHDCAIVRDAKTELKEEVPLNKRPSILATIVPEGSHEKVLFPLSYINRVPGQIIIGNGDYLQPDLDRQNFPSSHYYGQYLHSYLFESDKAAHAGYAVTPMPAELNYSADSKTNNHLAFQGYQVRWDYITEKFTREIVGNGHRAPRKLNHPGAKDYLNGSGGLLGEPLPIAQFDLY